MSQCQPYSGSCSITGWQVDGQWRCSSHWVILTMEEYKAKTDSKKMNKDIGEGLGCLLLLTGIGVIILAIGLAAYLSK